MLKVDLDMVEERELVGLTSKKCRVSPGTVLSSVEKSSTAGVVKHYGIERHPETNP